LHLVLHHTFDGGEARDLSGHANHGDIIGARSATGRTPGSTALLFDGVDDRVVVPASSTLADVGGICVAAWIRLDGTGRKRTVVEGYLSFALTIERDGSLSGFMYTGERWHDFASAPGAVTAGTWHELRYLYDGRDTSVLSVDDRIVARDLSPLGPIHGVSPPFGLNIGAWPDADLRVFAGLIDEVRIWAEPHAKEHHKAVAGLSLAHEVSASGPWKKAGLDGLGC
jgi:hypothetical protein